MIRTPQWMFALTLSALCAWATLAYGAEGGQCASPTLASVRSALVSVESSQSTWQREEPERYSYTVKRGAGPFGMTEARVRVRADRCWARERYCLLTKPCPWEPVDCGEYRMSALLVDVADALRSAAADVHRVDGFRLNLSSEVPGALDQFRIAPDCELEDVDWYIIVEKLKVKR